MSKKPTSTPAASTTSDASPQGAEPPRTTERANPPKAQAVSAASSPSSSPQKSSESGRDLVLIHGVTEDKKGLKVLRARNDTVEAGEVRPLAEGQPITSDIVRLKPRKGTPYLCDVETEVSMEELKHGTAPQRTGPAQVANQAYRQNWDAIWARPKTKSDPSTLN